MTTTAVRERPISFSDPMVRALLAGTKTQTRRVVKNVKRNNCMTIRKATKTRVEIETHVLDAASRGLCPFGQPGDRLWVRETWNADIQVPGEHGLDEYWYHQAPKTFRTWRGAGYIYYRADGSVVHGGQHEDPAEESRDWRARLSTWEPKPDDIIGRRWLRFMPRWASRITLEIVNVRAELMGDITEDDARAEGVERGECSHPDCHPGSCAASRYRPAFFELWDKLNAARGFGWQTKPWVWVIEFKVVTP